MLGSSNRDWIKSKEIQREIDFELMAETELKDVGNRVNPTLLKAVAPKKAFMNYVNVNFFRFLFFFKEADERSLAKLFLSALLESLLSLAPIKLSFIESKYAFCSRDSNELKSTLRLIDDSAKNSKIVLGHFMNHNFPQSQDRDFTSKLNLKAEQKSG